MQCFFCAVGLCAVRFAHTCALRAWYAGLRPRRYHPSRARHFVPRCVADWYALRGRPISPITNFILFFLFLFGQIHSMLGDVSSCGYLFLNSKKVSLLAKLKNKVSFLVHHSFLENMRYGIHRRRLKPAAIYG
jgi:hypothetical protein